MFASLRNRPLARAVPSVSKNRGMAHEEEVAANGKAITQLHTTSFGSLLGRKNTALNYLKVPRRNRSPCKDIRQGSAGSLEFASANGFGCLRSERRLQLACLGKKGKRKKSRLSKLRSAIFFGAGELSALGANAKSSGFQITLLPRPRERGWRCPPATPSSEWWWMWENRWGKSCVHGCSAVRGL